MNEKVSNSDAAVGCVLLILLIVAGWALFIGGVVAIIWAVKA